jgi:hypothetical protein
MAGFADASETPRAGAGSVAAPGQLQRMPTRRRSSIVVARKGALIELEEAPSSRTVSIIASPRDAGGGEGGKREKRGSGPKTLLGLKGWGKHSHRYLLETEVLIDEPVQRMWFDTLNPREFSSKVAPSNRLPGMRQQQQQQQQKQQQQQQQQPSSSLPSAASTPCASSHGSHRQPARARVVPKLDFALVPPESQAHFEARDRVLSYREFLRDGDASGEIGMGSRRPLASLTERNLRRVAMDEGRAYGAK